MLCCGSPASPQADQVSAAALRRAHAPGRAASGSPPPASAPPRFAWQHVFVLARTRAPQVCELFAVSEEQLLSPSSRRQLLAALLSDLLAAHWAAACGCPPSPRARVPLLPAAALEGRVRSLDGASLARAAAAAAKRAALLPRSQVRARGRRSCLLRSAQQAADHAPCPLARLSPVRLSHAPPRACPPQEARLQLGLLHYFQGDYQDAWLELGILLEQAAAADATDAWPAAAAGSEAPPPARAAAGGGGGEGEERLPPEVLAGAELLFEKLRLELLVAA